MIGFQCYETISNNIVGCSFYHTISMQNNQGLSKGYHLKPKAEADNPTLTLIILDITEPNLITIL